MQTRADSTRSRGAHTAREAAEETKRHAEREARHLSEEMRERAARALRSRQAEAAREVDAIVDALRGTAEALADNEHGGLAEVVERGADGLERMSDAIRDQDVRALAREAARLARTRPGLFAGGSVLAGFALARFLKNTADKSGARTEAPTAAAEGTFTEGSPPRASRSRHGNPPPRHLEPGDAIGGDSIEGFEDFFEDESLEETPDPQPRFAGGS